MYFSLVLEKLKPQNIQLHSSISSWSRRFSSGVYQFGKIVPSGWLSISHKAIDQPSCDISRCVSISLNWWCFPEGIPKKSFREVIFLKYNVTFANSLYVLLKVASSKVSNNVNFVARNTYMATFWTALSRSTFIKINIKYPPGWSEIYIEKRYTYTIVSYSCAAVYI